MKRDPERVAEDVRNGIVSKKAAREIYGVLVDKDCNADYQATTHLREQLKNNAEVPSIST